MKMLLVENDAKSVLDFAQEAKTQRWDCIDYGLGVPVVTDEHEMHRFLCRVCEVRPDVVIIDIALRPEEERLIDDVALESTPVTEGMFSGFAYCKALVREHWNIPVVFLTRCKSANVTRQAMKVGGIRVLVKDKRAGEMVGEITDLVRSRAAHDPAFFWQLSDALSADPGMWQNSITELALSRFFLNESIVRRFGLFAASLRGILSPFFRGDVDSERLLMLRLVKSQVTLSLVDPRLRDHVKHTGNVFWMGYRLLHEIGGFRDPLSLPGCVPTLYPTSDASSPWEQLLYAWTLAALFHDYGYVDERQSQLTGLVTSLVPGLELTRSDVRNDRTWPGNLHRLRDFAGRLLGRDHFICHFIDATVASFGKDAERGSGGKRGPLVDHGFFGAHRLLDMIPVDQLSERNSNIVLHSALAVAFHNYVDMLRKWKFPPECNGSLPVGAFPVCSLLAFCDCIQTWDREPGGDPTLARAETYDGLLERLVLSDTAYISGSEIAEFGIRPAADGRYDLGIKVKYFVDAAGGVKEVCQSLDDEISRWIDSQVLRKVCEVTGMSSLLQGKIIYELPMLAGIREAEF